MKFSRPSFAIAVFVIFFLLIEGIPIYEEEQVTNATDLTQNANGTSQKSLFTGIALILISGVVCALVAPSAVGLMVASLGFRTGGIALGSTGASLMSYTAPVASGGMVATCQSIGAAGLGVTGTFVSMAAGAVIGAGTAGFTVTSEWYKEKVEPSASKLIQDANEWYKEKVEPSASEFVQDADEWYKEKVEPSASEFAQDANEWYKEKVEPSASEFAQDAGEWYEKNIKNSASEFAQVVNGWHKQNVITSPPEID